MYTYNICRTCRYVYISMYIDPEPYINIYRERGREKGIEREGDM